MLVLPLYRLFIAFYFLLITLTLFTLLPDWGNDDPYITYRYAENLYAGRGFVYNPGERVLSTTSPLFALVLAGVRGLTASLPGPAMPRAANLIGAASLAVGALFLWDIARQWQQPRVGWAALVLYPTFGLLVRTLGSETPLVLALCLGAIAFSRHQRYTPAAVLLALAMLTRGDAALLLPILAADWLMMQTLPQTGWNPRALFRAVPWPGLAVGAAILLGWTLFAVPYFGSLLPVTLAVKRAQGFMEMSEKFAPGFWVILRPYFQFPYFWVETALMVIGVVAAIRQRWGLLFLGWAGLYFGAFTMLGVTRYFWYYAPLVPAMVMMIGFGWTTVQRLLAPVPVVSRILPGVLSLALAGLAIAQAVQLFTLRENPDPRLAAYRLVGEWLVQHTPPEARIGALEVGVIGYYAAPRPMVDFAGLIQPEVAGLFAPATTYQDTALWAVAEYQPDWIVLPDGVFPLLEQTAIAENCTLAQPFPGTQAGYAVNLSVYQCSYP